MTDKILIDRETAVQSLETLQRSPWKNWRVDRSIDSLTAALANAEPPEWQPIETAPKDGRPILLFGDCRVTSGHWSAPSETPRIIYQDGFAPDTEWDEWEPYWASWDGGFTEEHPPTHWMPLPAAPKDTL